MSESNFSDFDFSAAGAFEFNASSSFTPSTEDLNPTPVETPMYPQTGMEQQGYMPQGMAMGMDMGMSMGMDMYGQAMATPDQCIFDEDTGMFFYPYYNMYFDQNTQTFMQYNYEIGAWCDQYGYPLEEDEYDFDEDDEYIDRDDDHHYINSNKNKKKAPPKGVKRPPPKKKKTTDVPKPPPDLDKPIDKIKLLMKVRNKANPNATDDQRLVEPDRSRHPVNIVFIGHVDAGKSTTCGNILLLTGKVDPRTIEQYEEEARKKNRESWWLAYIMDVNEDERAKGKTVELGKAYFETPNKRFIILDAPGHKNYVPNMIAGACQADVAALVISARIGEFESGFERGGQTREHAILVAAMGVQYIIVLVNKMDDSSVNWSEDRYNQIRNDLTPFLLEVCGFSREQIIYVPASGLSGANILQPISEEVCPWYRDGPLLDVLDKLPSPTIDEKQPLVLPILDKSKDQGIHITGKIESGQAIKGLRVWIMPQKIRAEITDVFGAEDMRLMYGGQGDNVKCKLKMPDNIEIGRGYTVCDVGNAVTVAMEFYVDVQFLDLLEHKPLITAGYECILHLHTVIEDCTVSEVKAMYDTQKNRWVNAAYGKSNSRMLLKLEVERSIVVESYKDRPQLGKFVLRDEERTIGFGKVTRVVPMEDGKDDPLGLGPVTRSVAPAPVSASTFTFSSSSASRQEAKVEEVKVPDQSN